MNPRTEARPWSLVVAVVALVVAVATASPSAAQTAKGPAKSTPSKLSQGKAKALARYDQLLTQRAEAISLSHVDPHPPVCGGGPAHDNRKCVAYKRRRKASVEAARALCKELDTAGKNVEHPRNGWPAKVRAIYRQQKSPGADHARANTRTLVRHRLGPARARCRAIRTKDHLIELRNHIVEQRDWYSKALP